MSLWIFYFVVFPISLLTLAIIYKIPIVIIDAITSTPAEDTEDTDTVDGNYSDGKLRHKLESDCVDSFGGAVKFFVEHEKHQVWLERRNAQDVFDPFLLKEEIGHHIMSISSEAEITKQQFYDQYVNLNYDATDPRTKPSNDYLTLLSDTIFDNIKQFGKNNLPFHSFVRYPFDVKEVIDDMEIYYKLMKKDAKDNGNKDRTISNCSRRDLVKILEKKEFLQCKDNNSQRERIVQFVTADGDNIFQKFVDYLKDIAELFQNPRKIKNMLRDVDAAIIERGILAKVWMDQIHFIFDDIKNPIMAIPFFNYMVIDQEEKADGKVELWTIRNRLKTLYFLIHTTRKLVINENHRVYVSFNELMDQILELYGKENQNAVVNDDEVRAEVKKEESEKQAKNQGQSEYNNGDMYGSQNHDDQSAGNDVIVKNTMNASDKSALRRKREIAQVRMKKFLNNKISESELKKVMKSMFDTLSKSRAQKITQTTIDYYRGRGLKGVRLLQDDVLLRFVYEQLSRYVATNPERAKDEIVKQKKMESKEEIDENEEKYSSITMEEILLPLQDKKSKLDFKSFEIKGSINTLNDKPGKGRSYNLEYEMIPYFALNSKNIKQLEMHLRDVLAKAEIWFLKRAKKAIEVFEKNDFLHGPVSGYDTSYFQLVISENYGIFDCLYTHKQKKASIDEIYDIDEMLKDVAATKLQDNMKMNKNVEHNKDRGMHQRITVQNALSIILIYQQVFAKTDKDIISSADDFVVSPKYFCKFVDPESNVDESEDKWTRKTKTASNLYQSILETQQHFATLGQIRQTINLLLGDIRSLQCGALYRLINHMESKKNSEEEVTKEKWKEFITEKRKSFKHEAIGKDIWQEDAKMKDEQQREQRKRTERKNEEEDPNGQEDDRRTVKSDHDERDYNRYHDDLTDLILDNIKFDVIVHGSNYDFLDKDKEKLEQNEPKKPSPRIWKCALSFNAKRLTLQQLIQWAENFRLFLKDLEGETIGKRMNLKWMKMKEMGQDSKEYQEIEKELKNALIEDDFEKFKENYFDNYLGKFASEVKWLQKEVHTEYDLCERLYPFWSKQFLNGIEHFVAATDQFSKNYEIKLSEFGQYKYVLNIHGQLANELFDIIRSKTKTLSWRQIRNYLFFIRKAKYDVKRAILDNENAKQGQDTTVSNDGMKMRLNIAHNDNAKWLFDRVEDFHGKKITWRQIREYLRKTLAIREEIRVSFKNQEINRNYDESKAEIIDNISKSVEEFQNPQQVLQAIEEANKDMKKRDERSTKSIKYEVDWNYKILKENRGKITALMQATTDIKQQLKEKNKGDATNEQIMQMLGTIMDQMNALTEANEYLRQRVDNISENDQEMTEDADSVIVNDVQHQMEIEEEKEPQDIVAEEQKEEQQQDENNVNENDDNPDEDGIGGVIIEEEQPQNSDNDQEDDIDDQNQQNEHEIEVEQNEQDDMNEDRGEDDVNNMNENVDDGDDEQQEVQNMGQPDGDEIVEIEAPQNSDNDDEEDEDAQEEDEEIEVVENAMESDENEDV